VVALGLEVSGSEETLLATHAHPFRVEGRGWVAAGQLGRGLQVLTASGAATVRSVQPVPGRHTVYNLEVEATHTYFVGRLQSWVHNACPTVYAKNVGPGMYANHVDGWIPLPGASRNFKRSMRLANNRNGDLYGCHSCGSYDPGLWRGRPLKNWPIDHQMPISIQVVGVPFRGYPQCASCGLVGKGGTSQPYELLRMQRR